MGGIGPPVSCPTVEVGKAPVGPLSPQLQPPSAQVVGVRGLHSRLWFSFTSGPRRFPTAPEWMAGCGGRSYLLLLTLSVGVRTDVPLGLSYLPMGTDKPGTGCWHSLPCARQALG